MDITINTGVKQDNMINKTALSCIWRLKCIQSFYFEFYIERKMQKGSNSAQIVPHLKSTLQPTPRTCICVVLPSPLDRASSCQHNVNKADCMISVDWGQKAHAPT